MLFIYVEAPFAAYRTFTAGWYRPTAAFLTPSAAYGLALNLACIETRLREEEPEHDGRVPATTTRFGLPPVRVAIGAPLFRLVGRRRIAVERDNCFPRVQSVFQQLHNYPVGASGRDRAESTKGNKYNITPVRREILCGLRAVVAFDGNAELEERIARGIGGTLNENRYGIPFAGDNQFLIDRVAILDTPADVYWYERVSEASDSGPRDRTTRLTVWIDRADLSQTVSSLYAPLETATSHPTELAWTEIQPPQAPPSKPRGRRS